MYRVLIFVFSISFLLGVDHGIKAIYAVDTKTGEVIIDENGGLSLVPASSMKVVTTAAALHLLDPEATFETTLLYDGNIDEGILFGNIYIVGGGDPTLGSDRFAPWKQQIDRWVEAIASLGIRQIRGMIIADASRWEKGEPRLSWMIEDVGNYYGAAASALSFHENSFTLVFRPGKVNESATIIRTDPPMLSLLINNEVKTGPAGSGDMATILKSGKVRGTIPAGVEEFAIQGAVVDPSLLCVELLSQALTLRGISIDRQQIDAHDKKVVIDTTISPPMKEIIYWTNQKTINLYADHLLKKIGETELHEGTTDAGIKAVRTFLQSQGIGLDGFNMDDGSGLSRKNLITPKQLVAILEKVKQSKHFPYFLASLPKIGEKSQAKSGSMSLVKCYAGYCGDIAFAVMLNNFLDRQTANTRMNEAIARIEEKATSPQ